MLRKGEFLVGVLGQCSINGPLGLGQKGPCHSGYDPNRKNSEPFISKRYLFKRILQKVECQNYNILGVFRFAHFQKKILIHKFFSNEFFLCFILIFRQGKAKCVKFS